MNISRYIVIVGLGALVSLAACDREDERRTNERRTTATLASDRTDTTHARTQPDNTAKNKVDRSGDTKTPFDQSESSGDIKITAEIRRAIMNDDSMSMNAQNCKIITDESGLVTLRGVVNSEAEKTSIETKAKAVAGVTRVDNQLEVKTD